MLAKIKFSSIAVSIIIALAAACSSSSTVDYQAPAVEPVTNYRVGPGDSLSIFVWRNPDISTNVPVRPDGKISMPLVEDMQAVGKTPTQLSRDLEVALSEYIKSPKVNVIVTGFVGTFGEQVRVVGMATEPMALSFRQNMTLLDVMIEVGGLAPGAAGNRAKIVRRSGGQEIEIPVRIHDLLNKGKISANVTIRPGDILIIPESFF